MMDRAKDYFVYITNCTSISVTCHHVFLLYNTMKYWFSHGLSWTGSLHPFSTEVSLVTCSLSCICVWWILPECHILHLLHWISSFFFFSRPFLLKLLWIFNLPSSEHRLPSPCTLISLEHILFNLADCLGSYWIVLFQGWSLSEPSQHSILVFTVSYWKLLSKCSFVLVNFPC